MMVSSIRCKLPVAKKRKEPIMKEDTLLDVLGQVGEGEVGAIFRKFIRGAVISSFIDVMTKEVETLCSPNYHPCVRRKNGDASEEVRLESYDAAKDAAGVSGRDQSLLYPGSPLTSKSSVSRLWVKERG